MTAGHLLADGQCNVNHLQTCYKRPFCLLDIKVGLLEKGRIKGDQIHILVGYLFSNLHNGKVAHYKEHFDVIQ